MSELLDDTNHPVRFISPKSLNLVVYSMTGDEALGRLFCYNLELLSGNFEVEFSEIVGQQVTVILALASGERFFNGYITEFRYMGHTERYARYQATVRPWFWFLTRTADCRIFQEKTVPEIIKSVFRDNGMSDFDDKLSGTYRNWEYCVQYRETDFNFISRLMEQEGIYYYFKHEEGKHTLVLADNSSAHEAFPEFAEIPYYAPHGDMSVVVDHLQLLAVTQSIQPEHYAIQDFDFKKPRTPLISKLSEPAQHAYPLENSEIYDYPGEYGEHSDGEKYVGIRLEELLGQVERVSTSGPCRGLSAGCKFTLTEHPRGSHNKEYLVVYVSHQISDGDYISTSGGGSANELYNCQSELMDFATPYRHVRNTPKPIVQGPQTAIVVGPSDEEIYTDEFGRVKVQFHWDRYGEENENSSCWVRVSQYWAGAQWGSIHIPRIGQEVIVSFMEGDPDKPVITGRLYNAVNMPPYDLPADKTQSGVKSRSSKGGTAGNFNEIRMEDKKGSEELYIQAEKNERILVKNNKSENVGNDETVTIGHNRTETVQLDETLTVMNNRTRNVANTESVTVGAFRTHTVGVNENINIGVAQEIVVGGMQVLEIGGSQTVDVGVAQSMDVGSTCSLTVGSDYGLDVGSDFGMNVGKDRNSTIGKNESITIGKDWVVEAGDSVTIKCGSSEMVMKKDGSIQLKGKDITFKASGKISLKASKTITLKGSTIKEN